MNIYWPLAFILVLHHTTSFAFTPTTTVGRTASNTNNNFRYHRNIAAVAPLYSLSEEAKQVGEELIRQAAAECDAKVSIEWKPEKIVVTVQGRAFMSNIDTDEDDDWMVDSEVDKVDDEDNFDPEEEAFLEQLENDNDDAVNVVELARAINAALDDREGAGIGFQIAETHSLDVTTPGVPDELTGIMWTAYQGFDITCEFTNQKKKGEVTTLEGRLHARDDEYTTINLKGRLKKIPNEDVHWVKLPKAKQEKGAGKR